jgi:hypothetical protein
MQVQPPSHGTNSFFFFVELTYMMKNIARWILLCEKKEANLASNESTMACTLWFIPIQSSALMGTPDVTHKLGQV